MKNKLVLGILSCVVAVGCLTGCGNGDADSAATNTEAPAKTTVSPAASAKPETTTPETKSSAAPTTAEASPFGSPAASASPNAAAAAE